MNRKQRRATMKLGSSASANSSDSGEQIRQFFFEAVSHERARKFDDAVRAYKRVSAIDAIMPRPATISAAFFRPKARRKMRPSTTPVRSRSCRNSWNNTPISARRSFHCYPARGSAPPSGRRMAAASGFERSVRRQTRRGRGRPSVSLPASVHPGPRCRFRAAADSDAALTPVARGKILTN